MRYQQVYSSSEFASLGGPVTISAILFRPDGIVGNAFFATLSSVLIELSTTPVTPATLSTTFANNIGSNDTIVFNGPLALSSSFAGPSGGPKDFDIVINLTTPFVYDPSAGSLLLDVRNFDGSRADRTGQFDSDATATGTQRVFSTTDVNATTGTLGGDGTQVGFNDRGLVTEFEFTATTPEPSTFGMAILGVIGLIALARLKLFATH